MELNETARVNVRAQVEWLSDPERPAVHHYDPLDLTVHILYDDYEALPDPAKAVGWALHPSEVAAFAALEAAFGPLIDDMERVAAPNSAYYTDPRWAGVVAAARVCLATMEAADRDAP